MLILVGVSVSVVINSDLIGTAQNAGDRTETAYEEEGSMGAIKVGDTYYSSIEDYLAGREMSHNWEYTDKTMAEIKCTCATCLETNTEGTTLTIGQAVNYTIPTSAAGTSTISGEMSGVKQAIADNQLTASDYGEDGAQTISKDANTTWVVFGVDDKDGLPGNEIVLLTTSNPTTATVTVYGVAAYNNAINQVDASGNVTYGIFDKVCRELYGSSARAMTIDDVNRTLGYEPAGGMYALYDTTTWDLISWYTTGDFETTINADAEEEGTTTLKTLWSDIQANAVTDNGTKIYYTPNHLNGSTDSSVVGNLVIDGYAYGVDATAVANMLGTGAPSVPTTTSDVAKSVVFGSSNEKAYWLASRGVVADSDCAGFGPGIVGGGVAFSAGYCFDSDGGSDGDSLPVRAVVSLGSDVLSVVGTTTE